MTSTYTLSALFIQETEEGQDVARQWILDKYVGPKVSVRQTQDLDPTDCQRDEGCPEGCAEYRTVVYFDVELEGEPSFERATEKVDGLLLQPNEVINYEDEQWLNQ